MEDLDIDLYAMYEVRANELLNKLNAYDQKREYSYLAYYLNDADAEQWEAFVRILMEVFSKDV